MLTSTIHAAMRTAAPQVRVQLDTVGGAFCVDEAVACDALLAGGKPPTAVRLFKKGANPSTKGSFTFDDKASEAVMARYKAMGRLVTWDYDHGALNRNSPNPSETAKSAGQGELELRNGELWCVNIRWTPAAYKGIEDGEWPYFSPAFSKDGDNRPTWLINCALTANPALHNLDLLAEAASALWSELAAVEAPKCAVAVVLDKHGHILTVRQPDGFAAFPGGWIKDGETPEAAAVRECLEETGYPVIAIRRLHTDKDEDGNMAAAVECQHDHHAERKPLGPGEHGEVAWLSRNDFLSNARHKGFNDAALRALSPSALTVETLGHQGKHKPAPTPAGTPPQAADPRDVSSAAGTTPDSRREAARKSATNWALNNLGTNGPVGIAPDHDAASMPLTFEYPSPTASGGWVGAIEPKDGGWIAFVTAEGKVALWDQRNPDGSVQGAPTLFQRDIASLAPPANEDATSKLYNDNHDADGRFGDGGGGGGGGHDSNATLPAIQVGQQGDNPHRGGDTHPMHDPKAAAEAAQRSHEEDKAIQRESASKIAASGSAKAAAATEKANKSGSVADHERAGYMNRIAAGQHDVAAMFNPEDASKHAKAAEEHRKAAAHHEAKVPFEEAANVYLAVLAYANAALLDAEELAVGAAPPPARTSDDPLNYPSGPATADAPSSEEAMRAEAALKLSQERNAKAIATAAAWAAGAKQYDQAAPRQTSWRSMTAPLSGRYPDPAKVGGWIGWIEPADDAWIAFVAADGLMLLWQERDANGGVVGNPIQMWRRPESLNLGEPMPEALAAQRRQNDGAFSYGKIMTAGDGGLAHGISRRADLASHNANTPDLHKAAAATNRDVAAEHQDVAAEHRQLAADHADKSEHHLAEAKLHDAAAKLHNDRATKHDAAAAEGSTKRLDFTVTRVPKAQPFAATALSAIPFAAHPVVDTAWDADAAIGRLRAWASSDGSGDPDKIEWKKYGQGFAEQLPPGPDGPVLGDFKLPHHDVKDGTLVTVRAGVFAAAGAIEGARNGGVIAPIGDMPGIKSHLAGHYHQPDINLTPPWETEATTSTSGAGPADPTPTENSMHPKLAAYAATKKLDVDGVKARCLKAVPPAFEKFIHKAASNDPKDHPDEKTMSAIMGHLKTLDDMEEDDDADGDNDSQKEKNLKAKLRALKVENSALKALSGSPLERAAEGKLSIAALTSLGVAAGLSSTDATEHPDRVIRVACDAIEERRSICAKYGVASLSGLEGKIEAFQADAAAGKTATEELNTIKASRIHDAAALSIATAEKEGRLTPAKRTKADGMLAEKAYEKLTAFLDGCDVNPALVNGGTPPTTQLSVAQQEALRAAGAHPGAPATPPPAQPAPVATPSPSGTPALPADDKAALTAIMARPEFTETARGLGITHQPTELTALATQILRDERGMKTSDVIAELSATRAA